MMVAVAILMSAGLARAQEGVSPAPVSPVEGGKAIKAKSKPMTVAGNVKTVGADSLVVTDSTGRDWTFSVDGATKVVVPKETVKVGTVSPVKGGKETPSTAAPGQETVDVGTVSPVEGGKVIPTKALTIADIKEGQHVQVSYRTVDGKPHATQVRVN
jgi:hypothetical protein